MALMGFGHFQSHSHSGGAHGNGHVQLDVNHSGAHGTPGPGGHAHLGQGHGGHALGNGHGTAHGHAGQGPAHGHGHGAGTHGHTHHAAEGSAAQAPAAGVGSAAPLIWLLPFFSPLTWFSWMVGAGAAGMLARSFIGEPWAAVAALCGAVGFNQGVVKPIWKLVFGFASEPAGNLESCLLQEVEAVTAFDARGEGLVRVVIDGRSEDVLARLTPGDRSSARVRRGDRLVIEDVDPATNRCLVSKA